MVNPMYRKATSNLRPGGLNVMLLTPYPLRLTFCALRLTPYVLRLTPYALRLTCFALCSLPLASWLLALRALSELLRVEGCSWL